MRLSDETKNKMVEILNSKEFMSDLYKGLDEKYDAFIDSKAFAKKYPK